jgi:hypothetical protein
VTLSCFERQQLMIHKIPTSEPDVQEGKGAALEQIDEKID